jgi:hypothetical protein
MSQTPNLFLSVGKPVKDEYGRIMGKVASFAVTPSGKFETVFVEQGDGRFLKHSVEHLRVDGTEVILLSKLKTAASIFCDQIPLIWRKNQALGELSQKKKISPELYNELHTAFDGVLTQLKTEAQALSEDINKEISRCAEEVKALNYALIHLELEHEIGKIDNQSYEKAFTIIQENLKTRNIEKSDLELARNNLSNTLLGDKPSALDKIATKPKEQISKASAYSAPELPEPPVVVYVKEIGKTGI